MEWSKARFHPPIPRDDRLTGLVGPLNRSNLQPYDEVSSGSRTDDA